MLNPSGRPKIQFMGFNAKQLNTMELVGKIVEFTPIESGTSEKGSWQRCQVVIKTLDQNPSHVAFTAMGMRLKEIDSHRINEVVRIRFGVSSRKVNDRWFNDIQLWEIKEV